MPNLAFDFDLGSIDYGSLPATAQAALNQIGYFDTAGNYTGGGSIDAPSTFSGPVASAPVSGGQGSSAPSPISTDADTQSAVDNLTEDQRQGLVDQGIINKDGIIQFDPSDFDLGLGSFGNLYISTQPTTEDSILTDRDDIFAQADAFAADLAAFGADQKAYADSLLQNITTRRAEELPDTPEQAGTFIAGGSARLGRGVFANNRLNVGLEDLRIKKGAYK